MSDEVASPQETPAPEVAPGNDGASKESGAQAAPPAEQKHKLKFGKQEREVTTQELVAMAQKGWASDERFQEASRIKAELKKARDEGDIDKLVKLLKGKDASEFYKERLKEDLRLKTMPPEEREKYELAQEKARLKAEIDDMKRSQEEAKLAQLQEHYEAQYDRELSEAVKKNGLPKSRYAVSRAVKLAEKVIDMGLEPDWDLVVKEAKAQILAEQKELYESIEDDPSLLALLGENLPRRISRALLSSGNAKTEPKVKVETPVSKEKKSEAVDIDQWFKRRREEFEGK